MGLLPQKRSKGWIIWALGYGITLTALLWFNRFVVADLPFSITIAFRFALLAFVLGIVINFFGWLGARWLWLFTSLGTLCGLLLMFYYTSRDMSGWEDLASFLGFIEGVFIGFIIGLVAEAIKYVLSLRSQH